MSAQTSEQFIYQDKTYQGVYSEPLEGYLHKNNLRKIFVSISSTCWRGYHGTWKIYDAKLYLISFSGSIRVNKDDDSNIYVGLDYLFPNQKEVFAEWYSGEVKLVKEIKLTGDDHFDTVYRKETYLKFEDGILVEARVLRNNISFYDRIPSFFKHIFGSDSDDDLTFLDKEDSLLNKKPSKPFKEKFYSVMRISLFTLIVLPIAIIQMVIISVEYIYDNILFKIAKYK